MTISEYNSSVDDYADRLYRFVLKNIRDEEMAKDIIQDSYEKLWRHKGNVSAGKVRSYLFTTAHHTMIDYIRKRRVSQDYQDHHIPDVTARHGYSDLREIIDGALDKLPDIQRSVVLLRDYEGYSYDEIGRITGLNESQVKVYIYRARVAMKNYIVSLEKVLSDEH